MRLAILQPGYLPWLGFFEQMYHSDIFVVYDNVQYDKHGWRNRNRIKTSNGAQWLTVPVLTKGQDKPLNRDILIDNKTNWGKKHLLSLRQNYSKAPCFKEYISFFEDTYSRQWDKLIDLDMHLIRRFAEILGIKSKIVFASSLQATGDAVQRLISICKELGADTFYEGAAGKDYIDTKVFEKAGITLEFQDYQHPVYKQLYGDFLPYLSIVDLIFNHGSHSLEILGSLKSNLEVNE